VAVGTLLAAVLATGCGADGSDAKDSGAPTARAGAPRDSFIGYFSPEKGTTVGTGMIVSLRFNRTITDRAAVERRITVAADPAVRVAAHWFGAQRLDLRPAGYWRPGTRVTLRLRLRGVRGAPNVYGTQSKDVSFTVGRDQRSTVDAAAHTMNVYRDGQVLRTLPVTAGSPQHTTYNGVMVIAEKYASTRMNGRTVGFGGEYDIPDVPHAMRLTTSGTFVHGNYWSPRWVFGTTNVSHGCVGLRDTRPSGPQGQGGLPDASTEDASTAGEDGEQTPAAWFFEHSLIGDPVRVIRSEDRTVAPDNGLSGWNLTWSQWLSGSALN